jgi:hypothetical protein
VASLVVGVIWSVWRLPVVVADPVLRVPVPFLLGVIPTSVLFTWLFLHTRGSLLPAVLLHAWFDVVLGSGGAMVAPGECPLLWWLLLAALTAAAGLAIVAERWRLAPGRRPGEAWAAAIGSAEQPLSTPS